MKLQATELTWDKKIYPRSNKSDSTIAAYTEALQIDAVFPPVMVQRVSNYQGGEAWLVLDGVHRWSAYQVIDGSTPIEVNEWKPGENLNYEQNWIDLRLASARYNINHGDRLTNRDKRETARVIAEADPKVKYTEEVMAEELGVARTTINNWISDIRARQKAGRDNVIVKLSRLGWTQEEVAEKVGLENKSSVSRALQNANFGEMQQFLAQGRPMDWICEHYGIDMALAWALRLADKTDQERFEALGWGLRTWDHWYFNDCDPRFGDDWPGRIPAQLVAHTLFYFTRPGDLIFDPMAGGGVVPDTCLAFGRECRAYDLVTRQSRPEIEGHHWQLDRMAWPGNKKPALIFFDPPYFTKKEKEYATQAELPPISSLSRDAYLRFFKQFLLAFKGYKPKNLT